jgi:hypothetical protein
MNTKKIILIVVGIILICFTGAGFILFNFVRESQQVADTINHNQTLLKKSEKEFNDTSKNIIQLTSRENISSQEVFSLKTELESLLSSLNKNKDSLKPGDINETKEIYSLYNEYHETLILANQGFLDDTSTLSCTLESLEKLQKMGDEVANIDTSNRESLITSSDTLSKNFKLAADEMQAQGNCFKKEEDRKAIHSENSKSITVFNEISGLYTDLSKALKNNQAQDQITISEKLQSRMTEIDDFKNQDKYAVYEKLLLTGDREKRIKELADTATEINQKIEKINQKYFITIEQ